MLQEKMLIYILANALGLLGIGVNIMVYQQKQNGRLLVFKLISDIIWALHFWGLNAYSAAAIAVVGIFREIIFINSKSENGNKNKTWLFVFLFASILSAILTWDGLLSTLPAMASMVSVISFWFGSPMRSRIMAIPICLFMLIYDISKGSVSGVINEVLTLTSCIFGIVRIDKKLIASSRSIS